MLSSHYLTIDDNRVHYLAHAGNNNHTILILHGRGGSSASRRAVGEGLAHAGYTIIIPDLPGFGETPLPHAFTIDDYAQRVKKFIEAASEKQKTKNEEIHSSSIIHHPSSIILGHSNGGRIASYAIAKQIVFCDYLILNNAAGIPPHKPVFSTKSLVFGWGKYIITHIPFGGVLRTLIYKCIGAHDYLVAEKYPTLKQTFLNMLAAVFPDEIYESISIPTLILRGEHDTYTPLRMGQKIASLIPHNTLIVCKEQKHGIHLTDPKSIIDEVKSFIIHTI